MNNTELIDLFNAGKHEKAFIKLYNDLPKFRAYVLKQGGSKQQAEDIFQEALLIFYKRLNDANFDFSNAPSAYLFNTAKYIWWRENGSGNKTVELDLEVNQEEQNQLEEVLEKEKQLLKMEQVLLTLGEKCQSILKAFYFNGLKMIEIAKKFGYASEKSAKNQKYKCLERARNQIVNH